MTHLDVFSQTLNQDQQRKAADELTSAVAKTLNLSADQKNQVSIRFKMHRLNDAIGGQLRSDRKQNNEVSIRVSGPVAEEQQVPLAQAFIQGCQSWAQTKDVRTQFLPLTVAIGGKVYAAEAQYANR